jgi:hypothetical protein
MCHSITKRPKVVEDTEALRAALPAAGLVAFVGDGSVLPRLRRVRARGRRGGGGAGGLRCMAALRRASHDPESSKKQGTRTRSAFPRPSRLETTQI